jgi:hypothetical protein
MVAEVAAFGQTVLQLVHLALWDQVADKPVIIMAHRIHLLLDKDIQAAKADIILPTVLSILAQAVAVEPACKAVPVYTTIQIEDLKVLAVKAATMNGTVKTVLTVAGAQDQPQLDMVVMD